MRLLAALAALVLLSTSCARSGAGAAPPGDSLIWAVETEPVTFNPHVWTQNKARLLVFNQFDALVARDRTGAFIPWLATSWKIADDGLTYTFRLRDDVTFHDGEKFDAAAVKANLDQFRVPGYNPAAVAVQLDAFAGADVLDPATVRIRLKRPDGLFLDFLASPHGAQVSPKSLRTARDLKAGGPDVVGTGPFILDRYVKGQEVRYRRNPAYAWAPAGAAHQGPAHLGEITYRFLPEAAVRVGALTSGQVQVIEGVPATEIGLVEKDPNLVFASALNSGTAFSYYFNTARPPFDDKRVRQAFREAVDVDRVLASVYQGRAARAWSVLAQSGPFYDPGLAGGYSGDAAKAASLLDAAGWSERDAEGYRIKDGRRLTVRMVTSAPYVRDRRDVLAQAVQAQVKQSAGIDFRITAADQGSAQRAWDAGDYEVFENSRGDTDGGSALNLIFTSDGPINRTKYTDERLDSWLATAASGVKNADRRELYARVQRLVVAEEALVLPLYVPSDQLASRTGVQGLGFDPVSGTPASAYDVRVAA
ncbi:ABC transporter substrate-binding protein [Nonomuraea longicatena]|uniref:ABC transporter substrate-binding protein n=1 Tax=Nonomuraea longicatena TaxID=83682 RepID=A0ABP3ZGS3_9ACTN